jgi:hypothetical protein
VRSPGISDSIESGVTGYLAADEDGLDAAIVALMSDPDKTKAIGAAAREASKRFDIHRTVAETVKLYEELLVTRPDLQRAEKHGRWARRTEKWGALLNQLAEMVRPTGDIDEVTRHWWSLNSTASRKHNE